mmetsp:Transcript_30937/g.64698  ORF Transcript_30937/g.64698 Transcript_30937/m.64698 type:complete len:316 (+) Transcript_30937:42-989(+)|eukprot:CAMPEP_0171327714 /NCGR_PEP_ID=MMETSP0878-20121228/200_1 /TAXON_ID=67004 /ORGANISM="Thalassiosira weissflogii, Strain CCMP1336" /LENGTH=315 /DNA_ID=CAMNT_0011827509 /DNA_START=16 /DNA_END=963 /DNA_ORIENTATION=+
MTNPHKQHHPTTYALTTLSQTKMALHASRHGTASAPVHGVLLGFRRPSPDGDRRLVLADAVPICHEAPTKPLVEAALRLVEGYLDNVRRGGKNDKTEEDGDGDGDVKIVGWYTANAHVPSAATTESDTAEKREMPNIPAMKIASSMSESRPRDHLEGDFVLALVSTPAWTSIVNPPNNTHDDDDDDDNHPAEEIIDDFRICHLFERSKSAAAAAASFTHPVPSSRISTSNDPPDGNSRHRVDVRRVLSEALARVPLTSLEAYHPEEKTPPLRIYDYVDHVSNFGVDGAEGLGRRDWLENRAVASFVDDFDVGKMG